MTEHTRELFDAGRGCFSSIACLTFCRDPFNVAVGVALPV